MSLEVFMPFDRTPKGGGDPHEKWCTSCKAPIAGGQRSVLIRFSQDPHGHRGLTGLYHEHCGKRFRSLAHAFNLLSFRPS
jgi:hypothetical protein